MRFPTIFLSLIFFSLTAVASNPYAIFRGANVAGDDYFKALDTAYAAPEAVAAGREELLGWWAGRCFYHKDHTKAVAAVLAAQDLALGGDPGPAFPTNKTFKVLLGIRTDRDANWFDEIGPQGEKRLKAFVDENATDVTAAAPLENSLSFMYIGSTGMAVRYGVRRVFLSGRNFFIAKGVMLKASGQLAEGDTQSMCYYFDRVKVNPNLSEPAGPPPTETTISQERPSTVISGQSHTGEVVQPYCRCYCAGPVRGIGVRDPITNQRYTTYEHAPLFPRGTDGTVEYRYGRMNDANACSQHNGEWCEGYESFTQGSGLQGYAAGYVYGCNIFSVNFRG